MVSIFEKIMADKQKAAIIELSTEKPLVTSKEFFSEYCSKDDFKSLLLKCNENDLRALDFLFNLMSENKSFDVTPFEKFDANKNLFVWVSQRSEKTNSGFKVLTAGRMCQLIGIYGMGVIQVNLTLDELYESLNK